MLNDEIQNEWYDADGNQDDNGYYDADGNFYLERASPEIDAHNDRLKEMES